MHSRMVGYVVTLAGRRGGGYSGRRLTTSGLNENNVAIVAIDNKKNGGLSASQAGCDKNLVRRDQLFVRPPQREKRFSQSFC